ncbi:MAG: hypothetical protein V1861_04185 [Candidatus Micrarchaeota archaeon]
MDDFSERLGRTLRSQEYKDASKKAESLKNQTATANEFRLGTLAEEVDSFFQGLKRDLPGVYTILRIREKEIRKMIFEKKKGIGQ